jgi:hypothetical protein
LTHSAPWGGRRAECPPTEGSSSMGDRPHTERTELMIQLLLPDWPAEPTIGVVARDHGRLQMVASGTLHEPHSTAGIRRAVDLIVTSFLEPTLGESASEVLHDTFYALTRES